jgi:hypothetical protein
MQSSCRLLRSYSQRLVASSAFTIDLQSVGIISLHYSSESDGSSWLASTSHNVLVANESSRIPASISRVGRYLTILRAVELQSSIKNE